MILLPLLLQTVAPVETPEARFDRCVDLATGSDPGQGAAEASAWRLAGGGFLARQCLGMAYARSGNFAGAAGAFSEAAHEAEVAHDARAANYWAQAGNAWLAAGDPVKARTALNAALSSGMLTGLPLGEAQLDRARAAVASGNLAAAREDIDKALASAADDPLAWLLSATLARRMGDLDRARKDIGEALKRSSDDAQVQLEAGNIAAAAGDETGAKAGWQKAAELAPDSPAATAARKALEQFGAK
ncbi:tetratricopeptide repeat protein [Sphingomonas cannabina]|uniref:tetratricopeptide repeat protein n=1 Tax=Sphingomonas cannabina TaxID=2899123 RepID=UPI001F190D29|nr:tetratricopeptide repeat protein [Sphingomonas cannabina]UIJ45075.1 tetratricopeptide repeat protein [Sphingomonas cannabina]